MNIYETMWNELKQRVALADQYSLRKDIVIMDIANIMVAFERHFADEIEAEVQSQKDRAVKEELGLDPITNHNPQDVADDAE